MREDGSVNDNLLITKSKRRVGIAAKVIIPFVIISALSTAILTITSFVTVHTTLMRTLDETSRMFTANLSDALTDPLVMGEYNNMQKIIRLAKLSDQDVAYALALGIDGRVLANSDTSDKNALLNGDDLVKDTLKVNSLTRRKTAQENIFEMVTPIKAVDGQAGFVRVGFSTTRVDNTCSQFELLIICIGGAAILIGVVIYVALIRREIISPIAAVLLIAKSFADGDIEIVVPSSATNDEIGDLTRSFATMIYSWQQMADVTKRVSQGDLTATIKPRSERDVFAIAFNQMVTNICESTSGIAGFRLRGGTGASERCACTISRGSP
jgi:nitrogen fixation/metabolism regulation signal transduction histidine kinase